MMVDFSGISIEELGRILDEFPWFTLARREYVRRHEELGEEALKEAAAEAGMFFLSRKELLENLKKKEAPAEKPAVSGTPAATPEEIRPS